MGKVLQLKQRKKGRPPEGSPEEERLVKGLYNEFNRITRGHDEIIVCKAIAVFMGTHMLRAKNPGNVIGGFSGHIEQCINRAIAYHRSKEKENAPQVHGTANQTPPTQGDHRDLEVQKRPEVLCPPAVEQREGDVSVDAGTQPPGGSHEDGQLDDRTLQ